MIHKKNIVFACPNRMVQSGMAFVFLLLFACGPDNPVEKQHYNYNEKAIKDQFVKANQALTQKENDDMDSYVSTHKMAFVRTNSGVRYFVYKASVKGDSIKALGDSIRKEN